MVIAAERLRSRGRETLFADAEGNIALFGDPQEHHSGREGDVRLLNGREEPELEMAAGQTERWRFINASNSRYVRLSIGGSPFTIVGTDGGLLPRPLAATEVLITPGERFDLAVGPFGEGEVIAVEALACSGAAAERVPG